MRKSGGKHGTKFVPLNTADIAQEKLLWPGRRECTCEASKHSLINNCLECGRIVCEQEGSGPCFTCGNLVCTNKEKEIIARQSRKSVQLYEKLMNPEEVEGKEISNDPKLQSALEHKNRLLEYDRIVEKRTKVIDDENDYFQMDTKWLSKKEKDILEKKKAAAHDALHNRQRKTLTFDFAGRKLVEEEPKFEFDQYDEEELLKPETSLFDCGNFPTSDIPLELRHLTFVDENQSSGLPLEYKEDKRVSIRIQDQELQKMSDQGHCLSVQQPHASLLVTGIKSHEGRTWYTSYRGRLWIHAAGKEPSPESIKQLENVYRHIKSSCKFPKTYPTGSLVGCVDLVECFPQEEYILQYPEGEASSPYVYICENATELPIKLKMAGKNKIFKLESNIHEAAKKILCKTMRN